jgi:hypothetical protein
MASQPGLTRNCFKLSFRAVLFVSAEAAAGRYAAENSPRTWWIPARAAAVCADRTRAADRGVAEMEITAPRSASPSSHAWRNQNL